MNVAHYVDCVERSRINRMNRDRDQVYHKTEVIPVRPKSEHLKPEASSEPSTHKEPSMIKFESIKSKDTVDHWQYKVQIERKYVDFPFQADSMEPLPIYYYNPKTYSSLVGKRESSLKNDRKSMLDSSELNEHALKLAEKYQNLEAKVFDYFGFEDLIPKCGFSLHRDLTPCTKVVKEERIVCKFVKVVGEVYDGKESESVKGEELKSKTQEESMAREPSKGNKNRIPSERANGKPSDKTPLSKTKEKKEFTIKKEEIATPNNRFAEGTESPFAKHSSNPPLPSKEGRTPLESGESPRVTSTPSRQASLPPSRSVESASSPSFPPRQSLSPSAHEASVTPSAPSAAAIPSSPSAPSAPSTAAVSSSASAP